MNGESWGHAITAESRDWTCSAPRCAATVEYICTYRYVTGRAGRMTTSTRAYCPTHAERFAACHGLSIPSVAPAGHLGEQ